MGGVLTSVLGRRGSHIFSVYMILRVCTWLFWIYLYLNVHGYFGYTNHCSVDFMDILEIYRTMIWVYKRLFCTDKFTLLWVCSSLVCVFRFLGRLYAWLFWICRFILFTQVIQYTHTRTHAHTRAHTHTRTHTHTHTHTHVDLPCSHRSYQEGSPRPAYTHCLCVCANTEHT